MQNSWYIPYDKRVDLVLNGHDHFYERLTPVDPKGVSDPTRGIRQITEGTGAARLYKF